MLHLLEQRKEKKKREPKDFIIVENTHEAIISKKDFEFVQELLERRSRRGNNNHKSNHLFSNLLFCADCGKGMHFKKNRKGYVCGNFDKNGKYGGCTSHIIRENYLENIILNDMRIILKDMKKNYNDKINSKLKDKKLHLGNTINRYTEEINSLNKTKKNALIKLCNDVITDNEYKDLVNDIDIKISDLNSKIIKSNKVLDKLNALTHDDFTEITHELSTIEKLNKDVLNRLVKKIEVNEKGDVKIFYRFSYLQFKHNN